jgi:hypothetical protein
MRDREKMIAEYDEQIAALRKQKQKIDDQIKELTLLRSMEIFKPIITKKKGFMPPRKSNSFEFRPIGMKTFEYEMIKCNIYEKEKE